MYENQLAQLAQQTFNMESAALTTENLRNTMATMDAMQTANKELKKQYGKIDIDKIEVRFNLLDLRVLLIYDSMIRLGLWNRTFIMIWRICSNKQMKFKRCWGGRMLYQMSLTRPISKRVSERGSNSLKYIFVHETMTELEALALEEEEEGPSYLSDLNKVPDFVDNAPVEVPEVSSD
jgi:charged multivesicular body protein 5